MISLYREIKATVKIFVGEESEEIPAEEPVAEEATEAVAEEAAEATEE